MDIEKLKYPIGVYEPPTKISTELIGIWINDIDAFPSTLSEYVKHLNEDQLDWKYRPEGWTIRQVIHHCADSHMNALIRLKLSLTEQGPTIRPYYEDRWAHLPDYEKITIEDAITFLILLHKRWVLLLRSLGAEQFERSYYHPEYDKNYTLKTYIGNYSWHCNHHLAHIKQALQFSGKLND